MITKKASRLLVQEILKDKETIDKDISNLPKQQFSICPFKIILGAINTTEAGQKNIASYPSNYTDLVKVFSGREAILLYWLNSVIFKQVKNEIPFTKDDITGILEENNYWERTFKVGSVFKGFLTNNEIQTTFTPSVYNEDAVALEIVETINLTIVRSGENDDGWKQNDEFLDDIGNMAYLLFQIPEVFQSDITVDDNPNTQQPKESNRNIYKDSNKKYFYIQGANAIFDKKTKRLEYIEISFASVNDKLAKSNLADNQYLQKSAPGDVCAFPKIENGEIILDPVFLTPTPITHFQVGVYGNFAYTSIMFIGRPIRVITDEKGKIIGNKVFSPRLICPWIYQASQYNELYNTPLPTTNYYSLIQGEPSLWEFFDNWKTGIFPIYNIPAGRLSGYEGVFKTDSAKTRATNVKGTDKQKYLPYWDVSFGKAAEFYNNSDYNVEGSDFFYTIKPKSNNVKQATGLKTFNPSSLENKSLANWNLINFCIFKQFPQLPEDISQITPIALSSFPVIGGFLDRIFLGLQIGWKSVNNISQPDAFPVPALIPINTYEFSTSLMKKGAGSEDTDGLLSLDCLKNGVIDAPENFAGVNNNFCAFAGNLSDRLSLKPFLVDTANIDPNARNISTLNLKQFYIKDDGTLDETKLFAINESVNVVAPNEADFLNFKVGYVIDKVIIIGGNKSKYDINFFSQPDNINGDIDNEDSVWYGRYLSISNKTQNIRSWINEIPLSNPLWRDDIPPFFYPQNVVPPQPDDTINFSHNIIFDNQEYSDRLTPQNVSSFGAGERQIVVVGENGHGNYNVMFSSRDKFVVPAGFKISSIELNIQYLDKFSGNFNGATTNPTTGQRQDITGNFEWDGIKIDINEKIVVNVPNLNENIYRKYNLGKNTYVSSTDLGPGEFKIEDDLNIDFSINFDNDKLNLKFNSKDNGTIFRTGNYWNYDNLQYSGLGNLYRDINIVVNSVVVNFTKIT